MILSFLRDKILTFVLPVLLVAGMLGGIIWLVGKVYFWDTARLTLTLPTDTAQVKMTIQVPLVHKDINLFGFFSYPIHFILPWSRTQDCKQTCVFDRMPAGEALVFIITTSNTTQFRASIMPDTDGNIDLRPDFTMVPLVDEKKLNTLRFSSVSEKELSLLPTLGYENKIQGIYLVDQGGERNLYDATTKQILPLPISPEIAGRATEPGVYFLYSPGSGMALFDRYGRKPLTNLANFDTNGYTWSWSSGTTDIVKKEKKQTIDGIWWPLKENFITDGQSIMSLEERGP